MIRAIRFAVIFVAVLIFATGQVQGGLVTLVLDTGGGGASTANELFSTGKFSQVDHIDVNSSGLPTLASIQNYDSILAFTNFVPNNAAGLGNLLADYVDAGGHVVLATYAFSNPWGIGGRITDSGYAPLTNLGVNGTVSGNLAPIDASDPVFAGVDLGNLSYFHNSNFAHPGLDIGATLLATDGAGINMIARNSVGNVLGLNLYPGGGLPENNQELYILVANTLQPIPEPSSLAMVSMGACIAGITGALRRRRKT